MTTRKFPACLPRIAFSVIFYFTQVTCHLWRTTNTVSNTCAEINLRAEYIGSKYVNKNILSMLLPLLLHNEILSHPSVNTAYRSEGSFTFTHLGRPAELDPPQVRPWPVAFTFCGIFLPLCSSSSSCFFHGYISRKSHETVPVKPTTNFPPNSFESRDCCHNLSATDQLSRFTYRCRDQNAQWVQNAIWLRWFYLRLAPLLFRYRITFSMQFMNVIPIVTNFVKPERHE